LQNLDQDEEKVLEHFMIRNKQPTQKTLYDIIQEKIAQKQHDDAGSQNGDIQLRQLDPQLVEMYNNVGVVLSRYRSGKIPKAFKIIPKMINWEQILQYFFHSIIFSIHFRLTEPDKWTAAAMYQATRLFASNLNAKMCQR
jgi:essential nuclear protein 1